MISQKKHFESINFSYEDKFANYKIKPSMKMAGPSFSGNEKEK